MSDLFRGQRARCCHRVYRHCDNAADRAGDKSDSRFAFVCHAATLDTNRFAVTVLFRSRATIRNKSGRFVQKSGTVKPRSKSTAAKPRRKTDRRIARTRDTLGDALMALMHEKNFDDITVQNVLDRAGVGRSTFYVHYRDKEDLFLSDVEDFLDQVSSVLKRHNVNPKRLLPVQEFFAHIRDMREFHAALVKAGKANDVWALARGFFARSIEERLQAAGVK